jgi:hydroxyethylthiazole kinase-like uncharacterized protein yjeF
VTPDIAGFSITADQARRLNKRGDQHKHEHGHAVIISGPAGQGGAARLAAYGALRIGAGLVSVFCSHQSVSEHAARLDAVMVKPFDGQSGLEEQLLALKPAAVCVGPNFGLGADSRSKLIQTLPVPIPICLDADAITLLAREPDLIRSSTQSQVVMTPHEGELRRLIPHAFDQTTCRITLAKTAAQEFGCVVLFKGETTIVAQPDGYCVAIDSRTFKYATWLATAGSGDVLSGLITGLMARGFEAFEAAAVGAHIHVQCADAIGPGLIAEDIPHAVPSVLRRIISSKAVDIEQRPTL